VSSGPAHSARGTGKFINSLIVGFTLYTFGGFSKFDSRFQWRHQAAYFRAGPARRSKRAVLFHFENKMERMAIPQAHIRHHRAPLTVLRWEFSSCPLRVHRSPFTVCNDFPRIV
jgi:hypothetical protein